MQTSKNIHEAEKVLIGFNKLPIIAVHVVLKRPRSKSITKHELRETTRRERASADFLRDTYHLTRRPL